MEDYGVYREEQQRLQGLVLYHSYKTHILDRAGRSRVLYTGVWRPDQVEADLVKLLGE